MLTEVKNNIRYLFKALKFNLSSIVAYKASFFAQAILMMFNNMFFLIFWKVVFFVNDNSLNGLIFKNVALLWAISMIAWGIRGSLFGGVKELHRYIITGSLDTYFLQPKNMFFNIATSKCNFGSCGDFIYGIIVAIFVASSINEFILIFFLGLIGSIIFICVSVIIRMLSVWIGDVENISSTYEETLLLTFCIYPDQIYDGIAKFLMYTAIPAMYIVHFPIKFLETFDYRYIIYILIAIIIFVLITIIIFKKALKKYESGSVMSLKG